MHDSLDANSKKSVFQYAFLFTFLIGLAAHGFAFLNFFPNNDYMTELYLGDYTQVKIRYSGRFLAPVVRMLLGEYITLPWLEGLAGLSMAACAAALLALLLDLRKREQLFLLCGIFTTNTTMTSLIASYFHDFSPDMLALLLSVSAAYLWRSYSRSWKWQTFAGGIFCITGIVALYQSYLSVTVVLILLLSVIDLTDGADARTVLKKGMLGAAMTAVGFLIYLPLIQLASLITGFPIESSYNGLDTALSSESPLPVRIIRSVLHAFLNLIPGHWASLPLPDGLLDVQLWTLNFKGIVNVLLLLAGGAAFIRILRKQKLHTPEKLLCLVLLAAAVCFLNISAALSGISHDVMYFPVNLIYIAVLYFVCKAFPEKKMVLRRFCFGALCILIFLGIQASNTCYVKKDIEQKATYSVMTRALYMLETCDDYVYGETTVAFIGEPAAITPVEGTANVRNIAGMLQNSPILNTDRYHSYFQNVMHYPIQLCDDDQAFALSDLPEVQAMPSFPHPDCIAKVNDILVVKMG